MNETEWLASTDPMEMLAALREKTSIRRMRLLAVAICQTYRRYLSDERSLAAVELAYQVADGVAEEDERCQAFVNANTAANWTYDSDLAAEVAAYSCGDSEQVAEVPWRAMRAFAFDIYHSPRDRCQQLLLDIFGNPFRPVAFDPRWRTSDAVGLARAIYEERAFERMPILADALMDAGCEDEQIIGHCRGPGPHARGCWVVDLILGKE